MHHRSSFFVAVINVVFYVLAALPVVGQQLLFYNIHKQKTISVRPGHSLAVSYIGYNGVKEFAKLTVTAINDSTIELGVKPGKLPIFKNMKDGKHTNSFKVIKHTDIVGFRRITISRQLLRTALRATLIAGTYLVIYDATRNSDMSGGEVFLLSLGIGIAGNTAINAILPDKIKYEMKDGWQIQFVP